MPYTVFVSCAWCPWADSIASYALLHEITEAAEDMINAHSLEAHGISRHDEIVAAEVDEVPPAPLATPAITERINRGSRWFHRDEEAEG